MPGGATRLLPQYCGDSGLLVRLGVQLVEVRDDVLRMVHVAWRLPCGFLAGVALPQYQVLDAVSSLAPGVEDLLDLVLGGAIDDVGQRRRWCSLVVSLRRYEG